MPKRKRTVPWLDRRGSPDNGVFYANWYDVENRRTRGFSLRTSDETKATGRFAAFIVEGGELRKPRVSGLTVSGALDDYFVEHVTEKVVDKDRQRDIIRHLKAFFGEQQLAEVNIPLSRAYAEARKTGLIGGGQRRKNKCGAPATIRRELVTLQAAANHAARWGRLLTPVSVELPPEHRLGEDDEAPYYSPEEIEALISLAEGELKLFVELCYLTGARRRSIERLTRPQVKWPQRRILLQLPGKVATKKRQPIVPILKSMEKPLRELWDTGGEKRLFKCVDFYRPYHALCLAAGIDENRAHPHVLRHSRATHLLQAGKTIYDVAKLLGDTTATVERVYGHHSHDHLAQNLED